MRVIGKYLGIFQAGCETVDSWKSVMVGGSVYTVETGNPYKSGISPPPQAHHMDLPAHRCNRTLLSLTEH